ncbi:MAG: DUF4157 domain-containing protein [Sedimentisphaerales bacterium]|nr:DUF4157 domain-containing protein [Sedimentisphaerales bacterium]
MTSHYNLCLFWVLEPLVQWQNMPEEARIKPDIKPVGPEGGRVPPEVESAIERACGGGQHLEGALQEQMMASLSYDFSDVRIHTGPEADEISRRLTAKSFTVGRDIFFAQGAYDPASISGRELIAHELIHVVQQDSGRLTEPGTGMKVSSTADALEYEAEALAPIVARTGRAVGMPCVQFSLSEGAVVHRALADRVGNIPDGFWNIGIQQLRPACLPSVIYWVLHEIYGYAPPTNIAQNTAVKSQELFNLMLKKAIQKHRPVAGDLVLTRGSILAFQIGKQTAHAGVATQTTIVSGYNQYGWFKPILEAPCTFSARYTEDLDWVQNTSQVKSANNDSAFLYEIPEAAARGIVAARITYK